MSSIDLLSIGAAVIALAIAIIGHEIMHGWVAYRYGDTTAKNAGRLSINPIVHVDMFGTIIVPAMMYLIPMILGMGPGFLFGWAKPVPVNMHTVINNGGYNAAIQVSLAGIVYNLIMATLASVVLVALPEPLQSDTLLYIFTYIFIIKLLLINVVLAVFNMLPIPQFDGAHFLMYLGLKMKFNSLAEFLYKAEPYGMIIVIIMLMTPLKDYLLIAPVQMILSLLLS